jgi:hypothetical protein
MTHASSHPTAQHAASLAHTAPICGLQLASSGAPGRQGSRRRYPESCRLRGPRVAGGHLRVDYIWIEYRLGYAANADALGTVTYYLAATLKNGKLEIFYNQPQTEVCIYAIFPHAGYRPCWYATRDKVRTVS